jgi:hypothetical protein
MNTVWIALIIAAFVGIGIYFAVSDLTQQYALDTSGSLASGALCNTNKPNARPGQPITFSLSGVPAETAVAWSTPEGTGRVLQDGTFSVTFSGTGTKEVSAFLVDGSRWQRVACPVIVR